MSSEQSLTVIDNEIARETEREVQRLQAALADIEQREIEIETMASESKTKFNIEREEIQRLRREHSDKVLAEDDRHRAVVDSIKQSIAEEEQRHKGKLAELSKQENEVNVRLLDSKDKDGFEKEYQYAVVQRESINKEFNSENELHKSSTSELSRRLDEETKLHEETKRGHEVNETTLFSRESENDKAYNVAQADVVKKRDEVSQLKKENKVAEIASQLIVQDAYNKRRLIVQEMSYLKAIKENVVNVRRADGAYLVSSERNNVSDDELEAVLIKKAALHPGSSCILESRSKNSQGYLVHKYKVKQHDIPADAVAPRA